MSLPEKLWGCLFCRVQKQLYCFGEDQGRLPTLMAGELEDHTLTEEQPRFFFILKLVDYISYLLRNGEK